MQQNVSEIPLNPGVFGDFCSFAKARNHLLNIGSDMLLAFQ